MRKAFVVVALLAVAFAAVPASALVPDAGALPTGQYVAKYQNYSDLYVPAGATYTDTASNIYGSPSGALPSSTVGAATSGTPLLFGGNAADLLNGTGVLENRAIFNATDIFTTGGTKVWNGSSQQLSGLFYNLTLTGVTVGSTAITLDFSPSTRTAPLSGPGLATAPTGSGGVLQVYANTTLPWATAGNAPDPNGVGNLLNTSLPATVASVNARTPVSTGTWGPGSWVEGSGATSDTYVGASAGSLWLSAEFVPLEDAGVTPVDGDPTAVFEETVALNFSSAVADGFLHLVGGSDFPNIGLGDLGFGPYVDLTILSDEATPGVVSGSLEPNLNYFGTGYWPVDSNDPVSFDVQIIPEPATLSLLGFGLAGLLMRRRKK